MIRLDKLDSYLSDTTDNNAKNSLSRAGFELASSGF